MLSGNPDSGGGQGTLAYGLLHASDSSRNNWTEGMEGGSQGVLGTAGKQNAPKEVSRLGNEKRGAHGDPVPNGTPKP